MQSLGRQVSDGSLFEVERLTVTVSKSKQFDARNPTEPVCHFDYIACVSQALASSKLLPVVPTHVKGRVCRD